jgi:hypothetical protein
LKTAREHPFAGQRRLAPKRMFGLAPMAANAGNTRPVP